MNFSIAGVTVEKGERKVISIDVARLYDFTEMSIPVEVVRGQEDGPVLMVCAAIHGDEINGVEVIKRLLNHELLDKLKGTLVAVPIVNIFGFNNKSRYLPDRRDLNRNFPGSKNGSLAAKLAYNFFNEVVLKATYGIDLHTGALYRTNLPQIRACIDDSAVAKLANAFNAPVIINSALRDSSLRSAAFENNIPMLVFEGGEALKFNERIIKSALQGIISVMETVGMIEGSYSSDTSHDIFIARSSHWVRAPHSGILTATEKLGAKVTKGQVLGEITDPFGKHRFQIKSKFTGIIIGMATMPLLNSGDGTFHIATFEDSAAVEESVELYGEELGVDEENIF